MLFRVFERSNAGTCAFADSFHAPIRFRNYPEPWNAGEKYGRSSFFTYTFLNHKARLDCSGVGVGDGCEDLEFGRI